MVSNRSLISKSSSPSNNPLPTVQNVPIEIGITVAFMFYKFFCSQAWSRYLGLFSLSFLVIWSILGVPFVSQSQDKFLRFIFSDRFWVVQIPFVRMVKFKLLVQFPEDIIIIVVIVVVVVFITVHLCIWTSILISRMSHQCSLWQEMSPVGRVCKIHRLHLCRRVRPSQPNESPKHASKLHLRVRLQYWGM